ncbi:PAS domain S-box protein [Simplicispira psychrophila]|uniref:sensor histidine kinase n=1 Tax=Simplicispira psychrophila TaxID=80882 RepID=UPI000A01A5AC|nr:PAS domain S-box protein [Simplicispira psychrophila]
MTAPRPPSHSTAQATPAAHTVAFDDVPFRAIVTQSLAGIYVVLDERFMYANDTFAAMFGYSREEFIGRRLVDCITPDSIEEVMRNYHLRIRGEVPSIHYFTKGLRKDGSVVHLELHASRVECMGRPALTGVALDITERMHAQQRVRELAQRVHAAREKERARLAREVHDVLGGMLTSLKFDLSRVLRRTSAAQLPELHGIAEDMMGLMQETIITARSISEELRPASLDLLGLGAALRQTLERFGQRHGMDMVVALAPQALNLPRDVSTQIFRIVQQALTNIASHAAATRVELTLALTADNAALLLTLRDNGVGIDTQPHRPGAMGLYSMKERAHEIGATLDIRPHPEGGTELVLQRTFAPEEWELA